ncbi:helix-turn-helix domain-containing protein [Paracoccus benzoatiresistens]|uniref:Chromosomal replication initiator DnaA n=1 Tax=Paracoccus benzoatiresistens TaxID=2997341 RepID=A0ABT4J6U5_9RHOB|nr:helix-turn-helix domain-containing protein [Paracoccus sp. EF6]MCZ0962854.1 chromosomal replication initiator DnaA [Paracoccus sp. EF6]
MTAPVANFMTDADKLSAGRLNPTRATVRTIAKEVCEWTGHSYLAVMGRSQRADDCRVRDLVCFIAHRNGMSLSMIGRAFGRDHTTIMAAVRREQARRDAAAKASTGASDE